MNDFTMEGLSAEEKAIAKKVLSIIQKNIAKPSGGGCRAFYTAKEWQERGEDYGQGADLIIVHDGGDQAPFFNIDYMAYDAMEEMRQALEEVGAYAEQCTSWYSAIYTH